LGPLFDHVVRDEIVNAVPEKIELHGVIDTIHIEPLLEVGDAEDPVVSELN
jgi:hypothetical protein